jgi:hypothetical protein
MSGYGIGLRVVIIVYMQFIAALLFFDVTLGEIFFITVVDWIRSAF